MKLVERLKNLWKLSAYTPSVRNSFGSDSEVELKKNISTIEKKPAIIIKTDDKDILEEEIKTE